MWAGKRIHRILEETALSKAVSRRRIAEILVLGLLLAYLVATRLLSRPPAPTPPHVPQPVSRVRQTPDAAIRARAMGDSQSQRGEFDEAIHSYRQALQLDPSNHDLFKALKQAIRSCKAAKFVFAGELQCGEALPAPKSATQARVMGDSRFKRGDYDAAIDSYEKGLKLSPSSAELQEKLDAAMQACEKDRVTLPVPFTCGARNPLVRLIPPASHPQVFRVGVGDVPIPADDIERILVPVGELTVPPSSKAPPGAFVVFPMRVNIDGDVTPGETESDENGLGPLVLSAAQAWKFHPPTIGGEQQAIDLHVIVIF